ncbi:MAG: metal-dependent transcriptional regulator [Oscillospiraceae bacterium]|nr:metal-dependent transcriptional regulator [Oscillospiraceae bacterium]
MAVHKSGEDYLEAILMIQKEKGSCRSIDIVHHLGVSKPSVSVAMGILREDGMITTNEDGYMSFTDSGYKLATEIYSRHVLLTDFLVSIGVDEVTAKDDACKIEHDISKETFNKLKEHIEVMKKYNGDE